MRLDQVSRALIDFIKENKPIYLNQLNKQEIKKIKLLFSEIGIEIHESKIEDNNTINKKQKGKLLVILLKNISKSSLFFNHLEWHDFELLIATIFSELNYSVTSNYRFKDEFTRYEIDVLAYRFPNLFVIDGKFHKNSAPSYYKHAVETQKNRLESLIYAFPIISRDLIRKLSLPIKRQIYAFPLIISWREQELITYQNIPIVPISKLSGFLGEIDLVREELFHIPLKID